MKEEKKESENKELIIMVNEEEGFRRNKWIEEINSKKVNK